MEKNWNTWTPPASHDAWLPKGTVAQTFSPDLRESRCVEGYFTASVRKLQQIQIFIISALQKVEKVYWAS